MQRDQSFTHPCMSNYTLCFQAPGISTHHSWLWQETTTLEETLLSPHTLRLHGWCRLWVCHCCSAVKSGRDISKWWIQRWNLPQWYWVCQIKPKPRNIGLEESTFAEVLWTLRAWFGSLKMQGVPSLIFFVSFFLIAHLHPRGTQRSWMEGASGINSSAVVMYEWVFATTKIRYQKQPAKLAGLNCNWERDAPGSDLRCKSCFYILLHPLELICLLTVLGV